MRILLAEQARSLGAALKGFLEIKGYEIDLVYDGVQAINLLIDHSYDVVIAEMDLPRIGGAALVKNLRTRGDMTPMVGLLSHSEITEKDFVEGYETEELLPKPFRSEALLSLLTRIARSGKAKERIGYHQRLVLAALENKECVGVSELRALIPPYYGAISSFVRSTNAILSIVGSRCRVAEAKGGYKVVNV